VLAKRWGAAARLPAFRPRQDDHPLSLISPASDARISSTLLGAGGAAHEMPDLLVHPDDAQARGLADGGLVRVFNALGTVVLRLRVTDAVARGVVASEKGAWLATSPTGQTISALVSAGCVRGSGGGLRATTTRAWRWRECRRRQSHSTSPHSPRRRAWTPFGGRSTGRRPGGRGTFLSGSVC
jgi:anaerobic selenocysteine-containing dehydrogenase